MRIPLLFAAVFGSLQACDRPPDCGSNRSGCCATPEEWEENTRRAFEARVQDRAIMLRNMLHSDIQSLKSHVEASLIRSRRHLDLLFSHTYGPFYEQHSELFTDFFTSLSHSVSDVDSPISSSVDLLFHRLFRVIFSLLNPLKEVGVREWECMLEHMEDIRPFGDIQGRVSLHIERTLSGWKQLLTTITAIHESLIPFTMANLSTPCIHSLTRLSVCPVCSSSPLQMCRERCETEMNKCLMDWTALDGEWRTLMAWVSRLASRLNGPHNLPATLDALPALVSEAIMIFQERRDSISNKVITRCFIHSGGRWRRSSFPRKMSLREISVESETQSRVLLRVVDRLRDKLETMKDFFRLLPRTICSSDVVSAKPGEECANGEEEGKKDEKLARGMFVVERLRFGMLSFQLACFIYGKNYTIQRIEGSGDSDDEDYFESSGDISVYKVDKPKGRIKIIPASSVVSSSFSFLRFSVIFLLLRIA